MTVYSAPYLPKDNEDFDWLFQFILSTLNSINSESTIGVYLAIRRGDITFTLNINPRPNGNPTNYSLKLNSLLLCEVNSERLSDFTTALTLIPKR